MSNPSTHPSRPDVLLIHGTWCNGENWGAFETALQTRGFNVHAPTLRHHGNPRTSPVWANAQRVGKTSLMDYVDDLIELIDSMATPPIIVGHSVGALIAQMVAARRPNNGAILLGPAPVAGMYRVSLSQILLWGRYLPQWLTGRPMYPVAWGPWVRWICNSLPPETQESYYATLCAESGTAYREMIFWMLDSRRTTRVDPEAITSPVLVIAGSEDKCTIPASCRATARRYRDRGTYVELKGSDHMMTVDPYLPQTLAAIDDWLETNCLVPHQVATEASA